MRLTIWLGVVAYVSTYVPATGSLPIGLLFVVAALLCLAQDLRELFSRNGKGE